MKIKKKLRDLTEEEYRKYLDTHCGGNSCSECIFGIVTCSYHHNRNWIKNKELFSDKFLNQKIEIEVPDILNKEEKEYLSAVIKPFRIIVKSISKSNVANGLYEYISIETIHPLAGTEFISFPLFKTQTMYKNMKLRKKYTLEELDLEWQTQEKSNLEHGLKNITN